jgi:hypothetical protein
MATSAGHSDRPGHENEDSAGAVPGAVVLIDGAGIPGTESICRHGVAWYARQLGGLLLGQLSRRDGRDLATILAGAIDEMAAEHRDTCDIANPSSPQATVAMLRLDGDRADYLLLADSFLLLDKVSGGLEVLTDEREVTIRRLCTATLVGIARGASRIVSPYGLTEWLGVLSLLGSGGPEEIIRRVRQAEASTPAGASAVVPDDATIAYCTGLSAEDAPAHSDRSRSPSVCAPVSRESRM